MTDTPQGAWMREYEDKRARIVVVACRGPVDLLAPEGKPLADAIDALDAHVRGLVEENERLRGALAAYVHACYEQGINLGPITGDAEAALTTPKDAP